MKCNTENWPSFLFFEYLKISAAISLGKQNSEEDERILQVLLAALQEEYNDFIFCFCVK